MADRRRYTLVSVALGHVYEQGGENGPLYDDQGNIVPTVTDDRIIALDCQYGNVDAYHTKREAARCFAYRPAGRLANDTPGENSLVWSCPRCNQFHYL